MSVDTSETPFDAEMIASVTASVIEQLKLEPFWRAARYVPNPAIVTLPTSAPFMEHSSCGSSPFYHPRFAEIATLLDHPVMLHRKLWEWVFVIHNAIETKSVGPGKRALGFGVGTEKVPAVFAEMGTTVVATDAPNEIGVEAGWVETGQFSAGLAGLLNGRMERKAFERLVSYSECDMNGIDPALKGFDFCWSSCAFEHLGDLRKGMDFVINSLETLKVGGVAVHTTELNLSSNEDTLESGFAVLYRRRDLEQLIGELRDAGHEVAELRISADSLPLDGFVDIPPYNHDPHLKLRWDGYVTTSVGLVIRKGQ